MDKYEKDLSLLVEQLAIENAELKQEISDVYRDLENMENRCEELTHKLNTISNNSDELVDLISDALSLAKDQRDTCI